MADKGRIHTFSTGDRVVVIANPSTRASVRTVTSALTQAVPSGVRLDLRWTPGPGTANALAREALDTADGIIAVGGDGTVSDVAAALVGTGMPLGVLPGGSTNIVAREHGIPANLREAASVIFRSHRLLAVDVATCNGRPFLHMAGAGFDSVLFDNADPELKRRVGWMAYLPAGAKALTEPPATYTIEIEGETIRTLSPLVLIANGSSIIRPELKLAPSIRPDDGWLDLIVVTGTKPHELASVLGRLATLRFDTSPLVLHRRVKSANIMTSHPVPMQLDGDVVEHTPALIGIMPASLNLIVPVNSEHW